MRKACRSTIGSASRVQRASKPVSSNEKLQNILATILQLAPDAIRDDLTSEDVDTWDSLNHIALMGALEQEFDVRIDIDRVEDSHSVSALKAILTDLGISFADDGTPS